MPAPVHPASVPSPDRYCCCPHPEADACALQRYGDDGEPCGCPCHDECPWCACVLYDDCDCSCHDDGGALDAPECHFCGCTDELACPGGCWWVSDAGLRDVCSRCDDALADLEQQILSVLDAHTDRPGTELVAALRDLGLDAEQAGCGRFTAAAPSGDLTGVRPLDSEELRWTAPGAPAALSASERGGLVSTLAELAFGASLHVAPAEEVES